MFQYIHEKSAETKIPNIKKKKNVTNIFIICKRKYF